MSRFAAWDHEVNKFGSAQRKNFQGICRALTCGCRALSGLCKSFCKAALGGRHASFGIVQGAPLHVVQDFAGQFQDFAGRFQDCAGRFQDFVGRFQDFVGRPLPVRLSIYIGRTNSGDRGEMLPNFYPCIFWPLLCNPCRAAMGKGKLCTLALCNNPKLHCPKLHCSLQALGRRFVLPWPWLSPFVV